MRPVDSGDYCLGIVGLGAMGQGIAQVAAMGGIRTLLFDARAGAAAAGKAQVVARLERLAGKGRLAAPVEALAARLEVVEDLAAFAACDAVVEAIVEDLAVKAKVFADLEAVVGEGCILASNTSSIPIGALARGARRPARIAGMHFFNPVPVMRLVEIIRGPATDPEVCARLAELGERLGRTPVQVKDAPGFLVNFGGRAFLTEGLRLEQEGVASVAQIDAILRDCCGFRMGPFELMDLTGIDVNYPVTTIVHQGYMGDPRLATVPLHRQLYEAGRLGRKTARGFYDYDDRGGRIDPEGIDFRPAGPAAARVVLLEPDDRLTAFAQGLGVEAVASDDGVSPILAYPVGEDATTLAVRTGADHRRLVAVDLSASTERRVTLMTAPGADPAVRDAVAAAVTTTGRAVTAIADSPGFVALRMRAFVANLGCYMAQIGLAEPAGIDTGMRLGLNYPAGPLEMAEDLGLSTTLQVLERLQAITGDDRYRPTLWLRRRALLGLPIRQPN